jgi:hypothetical protein
LLAAVTWSPAGAAFRNCEVENSHAWSASTRYMVGEIEFDPISGRASGTKTFYNYANHYENGADECHVTYELSGSYAPGSGTFVLEARRTNLSRTCPPGLVERDYPEDATYAFQMDFTPGGSAAINRADSGELLARGSWEDGRTVYKTGETCTVF